MKKSIISRFTLFSALLFGMTLNTALASPKLHHGIPVTTQSQEAFEYFTVGQTLLDEGKSIEAQRLFKAALEVDPGFSSAWLGFANSATSAEEFQQGISKAKLSIDKASVGEQLLHKIALTYLKEDLDARAKLVDQLVQTYPNSPRAWLVKGDVLGDLNKQKEQRAAFAKSVEIDATFIPGYTNAAFSYIFQEPKDFKLGEQLMRQASRMNPASEQGYINLGDAHRANNQLSQASQDYNKASLINNHSPVAFVKKGHVDSFMGNFDSAEKAYQQALLVSDDVSRPFYANYETFISLYQDKPLNALADLDKVQMNIDSLDLPQHQKDSAKVFALTNQATIALHNKLTDKAKVILDKRDILVRKVATNVNDADFTRNQEADIAFWRGQLAARMGDFKTAQDFANENKGLVRENNSPRKMEKYYELVGLVALLSERFADAKTNYNKADPNSIYVKYHLALATDLAGDKNAAKNLFKEVATYNFNSVEFALIRKDAIDKAGV